MTNVTKTPAVILAAGRGRRLMPHTKNLPKCLVLIDKHPILYYQLRALELCGIRNITIVTGYLAFKIRDYTHRKFPHLKFRFVHNDRYQSTNDIYSLFLAQKYVHNNFILLDSDVLFPPAMLYELLLNNKSAICLRKARHGKEEMKVALGKNNTVTRLSKSLPREKSYGEFMGLSFFSHEFLDHLNEKVKEIVSEGKINVDREVAIERVLYEKIPLGYIDSTRHPVIEIDFPRDLKAARIRILPRIAPKFLG